MIRTQIQLTEEQAQKLEEMAAAYQVSKAQVVRLAIDRLFAEKDPVTFPERVEQSLEVLGLFSSEHKDISVNHDQYLAETYGEW